MRVFNDSGLAQWAADRGIQDFEGVATAGTGQVSGDLIGARGDHGIHPLPIQVSDQPTPSGDITTRTPGNMTETAQGGGAISDVMGGSDVIEPSVVPPARTSTSTNTATRSCRRWGSHP